MERLYIYDGCSQNEPALPVFKATSIEDITDPKRTVLTQARTFEDVERLHLPLWRQRTLYAFELPDRLLHALQKKPFHPVMETKAIIYAANITHDPQLDHRRMRPIMLYDTTGMHEVELMPDTIDKAIQKALSDETARGETTSPETLRQTNWTSDVLIGAVYTENPKQDSFTLLHCIDPKSPPAEKNYLTGLISRIAARNASLLDLRFI